MLSFKRPQVMALVVDAVDGGVGRQGDFGARAAQKRADGRAVPIMLRFLLSGLDNNCCMVVKLSIYIPSSAPKQAPKGGRKWLRISCA
jgi:hypothetical protein